MMKINKRTTTREIIDAFVSAFPFLKIVFYKNSHDHFSGSLKNDEIKKDLPISDLNPNVKDGTIDWKGNMSVDALETHFEEKFGLHVQVFRKSGDIWLQTSKTDHWTLDEQNNRAADSERFATK